MLWLFEILSPSILNCSLLLRYRKFKIFIHLLGLEFGSISRLGSAVNLVNLVEYYLEPYIFLLLILYSKNQLKHLTRKIPRKEIESNFMTGKFI